MRNSSGPALLCASPNVTGRPVRRLISAIQCTSARVRFVVRARALEARRDLVHAVTAAAEHVGDREQLAFVGPRAGHRAAVGHAVQQRARRREAERARAHRLVDEVAHRGDVVVGRGRLVEAALAHRVVAHRAVADHAADVDALGQRVDRGEVLAVGLPVPGEPVEDRVGGDVLDRLHELGEPALLALADRART